MNYLLDTNACIALINGAPALVRTRFTKALDAGAQVLVPTVVVFELWYGVGKSARPEPNAERVETFLDGPVGLLSFEEEDARRAGVVRSELELTGKPIGAYDVLIAGQALCRKLTLVTSNGKEFGRVKGLVWEDWAKGKGTRLRGCSEISASGRSRSRGIRGGLGRGGLGVVGGFCRG